MFVNKIYQVYGIGKKFFSSKSKRRLLTFFILIFAFFGAFNAYAAEIPQIGLSETYKEGNEIVKVMTGTDQANNMSLNKTETNSGITNLGIEVCPRCFKGYEKLVANPNISPTTKAGLVGLASNNVQALMYNPPYVDVGEHLAREWVPGYEDSNTGVFAGGYNELEQSGIVGIWSRTRNIAYLMFVVVLIVAGFMIMFRSKLGGQTVVTLGNMIPNVIFALILATFSFAIVGIIIDFGALLGNIAIELLYGKANDLVTVSTKNPFAIMKTYWGNTARIRRQDLQVGDPIDPETIMDTVKFVAKLGAGMFGPLGVGITASAITEELYGVKITLLTIIISGIMFVGALQVWIALLKAYIGIIISTIIAPIQIALSAIPGQKQMLGNWFKTVLRNVLTFPLVLAMVNLPFALWGEDINYPGLPESLVANTNSRSEEWLSAALDLDELIINILKIVMLFMAAQAPKFLESIFPPNTSKAVAEGIGGAKAAFSKIPLVGKLFA
jgi:hypothetical protein